MGTTIRKDIKDELVRRGLWREFGAFRQDLVLGGKGSYDAAREAMEKIAPDLADQVMRRGRPAKGAKAVEVLPSAKAPAADASSKVARGTFDGKACSLSASFMWAYANLSIEGITASDAPSAVAWQMYCDMTKFPSLKSDMLKSGLTAAFRKSEAEEDDGRRFDGEAEYDILGAISGGSRE